METKMTVGAYTYHLVEYAYVTVDGKNYIGRHKSPNLKFAGELLEVAKDHEWLTPLTPIEHAPVGDTFVMEGGKGDEYSRHYLEEQLKEEKWLESRRVKPSWQTFSLRQPT